MTLLSTTPALVTVPGTGGSTYTATFKTFTNIASPGTTSEFVTLTVYYIDSASHRTVQVQKTDYITKNPQAESIQIEFQGKTAPVGSSVTMVSSVPYTQVYSFPPGSPVDPATVELALDRVVMMAKQNYDRLNNTVGLENPPTNAALRLIVPEPIVTNSPIYWVQDPTNASRYILHSADFTIDEFRIIYLEILAARDQAVAAAAAAQGSAASAANSAIASANSAASSAQTFADIQVYGTQLRVDMEEIKNETEDIKDEAEVFRDEAEVFKDEAEAAAHAAEQTEQDIINLVSRFPSPVGQPINKTYVTDGAGHMVFQPYYPIENMDTATSGQVITVQDGPNGKELIAASPITTSEKVATFDPSTEGGTTVSAALMNHEKRLGFLENMATIYPYGKQHAVADFIVNVDGNLRNAVATDVVLRENAVDIIYENFGAHNAYWTSGNNFTVPANIATRPIFSNTCTMMFGIYVDANTPDTVIFSNTALIIKKVAANVQFLAGSVTVNMPLIVNQWIFYCLTFNGATISGHVGEFNAGIITVTDISLATLVAPIVAEDLSVNMETNLRLVRLTFVDVVVTKTQFETWLQAIYGLESGGSQGIPDPTTGSPGQAPVIDSGAYYLKYPLLADPITAGWTIDNSVAVDNTMATGEHYVYFDANATTKTAVLKQKALTFDFDIITNVPPGYTLNDTIDASTELTTTGLYNWYIDVNTTAKTITLKVSKMFPPIAPTTTLFTAVPTPAIPQLLIALNASAVSRLIQNITGYDIVVGTQAQLAANDHQGISIRSNNEYTMKSNSALYVRFPTGAVALPADAHIAITEEVLV